MKRTKLDEAFLKLSDDEKVEALHAFKKFMDYFYLLSEPICDLERNSFLKDKNDSFKLGYIYCECIQRSGDLECMMDEYEQENKLFAFRDFSLYSKDEAKEIDLRKGKYGENL